MEPMRGTAGRHALPSRRACWLVLVLLAGCRSNPKYDLIEAELRTRDRELAETRAELTHAKHLNDAFGRGLGHGPTVIAGGGAPNLPLREITLGSGTGGLDMDGVPGDELLQVVIVPKDDDGSAIKVPAKATVQAFEISRDGLKTCIGSWDVSPEQLRRTWRGGLFTTGYFISLQWDKPPVGEKLRIAVRLTTLDGRPYETDKDVSVRPLGGLPPQAEELPPPSPAVRFAPPR